MLVGGRLACGPECKTVGLHHFVPAKIVLVVKESASRRNHAHFLLYWSVMGFRECIDMYLSPSPYPVRHVRQCPSADLFLHLGALPASS